MSSWESVLYGHQCWSSPNGSVPSCRSILGARAQNPVCLKPQCHRQCRCQRKLLSACNVCKSPQQGSSLGKRSHAGLGMHQDLPFVTQFLVSSMGHCVLMLCPLIVTVISAGPERLHAIQE